MKQKNDKKRQELEQQLRQRYLEPWERERILQHLYHLDTLKKADHECNTRAGSK